ncbi:MAG: hypothetical protein SVV80_02945 [Planctomycetota bacterium]|nr:hypothetical protein [Planctomycetota bacterium]
MTVDRIASGVLTEGQIIREPDGHRKGCWIGAPAFFYDRADRVFYLSYRLRRPRGVKPDRGAEVRIARSSDGVQFEDIVTIKKDTLATTSIERCPLYRGPDGQWRFFLAYVDPADKRWCISVLKAPSVEQLNPKQARRIFSGQEMNLEGIKDPWIFEHDGLFYMIVSVALATADTSGQSHATFDIYNTGQCLSATGLAASSDLEQWQWRGVVFEPSSSGWDCYCRRIDSVVAFGGRFFGFYDGLAGYRDNYEEKTGLAVSSNMKDWRCLTPDGPVLTSPHGSGALRYVDAQIIGEQAYLYYELARPDEAHDLRAVITDAKVLTDFLVKNDRA